MSMDIAIMIALGLHAAMLIVNTSGWLSQLVIKVPAVYSLVLLATMLADRYA